MTSMDTINKMQVSLKIQSVILLFTLIVLDTGVHAWSSPYEKTQVFQETTACIVSGSSGFRHLIGAFWSPRVLWCAIQCSRDENCRRIMYDQTTKLCSMFKSGRNCFTDGVVGNQVCYRQKWMCESTGTCRRCPIGHYGSYCDSIIKDCTEGKILDKVPIPHRQYLTFIQPRIGGPVIEVKCDFQWGGYTFIQHKNINCNEIDFNRGIQDYVEGFGEAFGEHWIGLQHIYDIAQNRNTTLFSVSLGTQGSSKTSFYHNFKLSSGPDFKIFLSGYDPTYAATAGDSLTDNSYSIDGRPFSTYDRDSTGYNCPDRLRGGWWYLATTDCCQANVNGLRATVYSEPAWHWHLDLGTEVRYSGTWVRLKSLD